MGGQYKGHQCPKYQELPHTRKIIYSYASNHPCGASMAGTDNVAHRIFTKAEQEKSSTFRQLMAIQLVLFLLNQSSKDVKSNGSLIINKQ